MRLILLCRLHNITIVLIFYFVMLQGDEHGEHQNTGVHGVRRPLLSGGGGGHSGASLLPPERVRLAGRDQHAGRCHFQRLSRGGNIERNCLIYKRTVGTYGTVSVLR
jgi:hypothetical protein